MAWCGSPEGGVDRLWRPAYDRVARPDLRLRSRDGRRGPGRRQHAFPCHRSPAAGSRREHLIQARVDGQWNVAWATNRKQVANQDAEIGVRGSRVGGETTLRQEPVYGVPTRLSLAPSGAGSGTKGSRRRIASA